ncbi:hypothetical protein GGR51DRAFT_389819 [Nemania sp. FL0031]|nr:hypothetical protein GGR51DRAFT_389819 [Nemania sp. FL0031]
MALARPLEYGQFNLSRFTTMSQYLFQYLPQLPQSVNALIINLAPALGTWYILRQLFRRLVPSRQDASYAPKKRFGLEPLEGINPDSTAHGVDIIFVHGLGSNPDTTWLGKAKRDTPPVGDHSPSSLAKEIIDVDWITTFLYADIPDDIRPHVRIFFYNHNTAWLRDVSGHRLSTVGRNLVEAISTEEDKTPGRSIILVGHSYGGLIVKDAIDKAYDIPKKVSKQFKAAVFLGTPHRGSISAWFGAKFAQFLSFLALDSNPDIVKAITYDSVGLRELHSRFAAKSTHLRIVNFYEMQKLKRAYGLWDEIVVTEQSATLERPDAETIGLDTDHVGLNKFGERNGNYRAVKNKLVELIDNFVNVGLIVTPIIVEDDTGVARKEDLLALQRLRITDPRDDKMRIENQKGQPLRDSYQWIFRHETFRKWRDSEGNQLLWIKGDPGKGKTMLLCGIIDELHGARIRHQNIAYFFCQATSHRLNRATSVLRGLIYSLLSQRYELLNAIRIEINQAAGEISRDMDGARMHHYDWHALCRIFARLAQEIGERRQTTYLIVDALDECLEDQHLLLRWIADLSFPRIKLLVSSRNCPTIESGLRSAAHKMLLHLELNADSISHAVDHYIDYEVAELGRLKDLHSGQQEAIRQYLKSGSDNTFLWVALVCRGLSHENTRPWEVLNRLHDFPPGLQELYGRMATQFLKSKHVEICRQVLAVQVLAYRPLRLTELIALVESPERLAQLSKWLRNVVELCGSFLTVRDETIYFVHKSAKDYLIDNMASNIFPHGRFAGHNAMFIKSIETLSRHLRENICKLPSPGSLADLAEVAYRNPSDPNPLEGMHYGCIYWADHLADAMRIGEQHLKDRGLVHMFLETHLLHWLEALSIFKSLGQGIEALTKLLSLLRENKEGEKSLYKLVYDAGRFSRHFKIGIETTPLQVYSSALAFSPTGSDVRRSFLKKPEWMLMSPTRENNWSPCLEILEGHKGRILSLAFSSSGGLLVSGSNDSTARIWDVVTGECLNILTGHDNGIYSVAFSPSGQYVASGSFDGNIRIWNTKTGIRMKTIETFTGFWPPEPALAAFPDNERIMLVYPSGRVYIHAIPTGIVTKVMEIGNSADKMDQLCLSRDGKRAAWISQQNRMIEAGDVHSNQDHNAIWNKELSLGDYGVPVALLSDGEYVIAMTRCSDHEDEKMGNGCHMIQVWNVARDECVKTLHQFGLETQTRLALSPNHRYLAAASGFDRIEWDITTGQPISITRETQHRRKSTMALLEFSPSSELLVSTEFDTQIWVWEMTVARRQNQILGSLDIHWKEQEVESMALSPNGQILGILNQNHNLQIWDTINNKSLSTIIMKSDYTIMKFSPDGRQVACTSQRHTGGSTVELFDVIEGSLKKDNPSTSHDTIYIFDAIRGGPPREIPIPSPTDETRRSISWAISPRGETMAIIYYYRTTAPTVSLRMTLQIWNIAQGLRTRSISLANDLLLGDPLYEVEDKINDPLLTFSPDVNYLAYVGKDNVIHIVDIGEGTTIKRLEGFWDDRSVSASISWGPAGLVTHRGIYDTQALLSDTRDLIHYGRDESLMGRVNALLGIGISPDRNWILRKGERHLWIPPENRGPLEHNRYWGSAGNTIAFGYDTDRMYCFRFP